MQKIVIIGASGHGKVVADIIERAGMHVAGFIDLKRPKGTRVFDYDVLGNEETLPELVACLDLSGGVIAIGDNWQRAQAAHRIQQLLPNFPFFAAVHPAAQLARGASIGAGTVVMAGAVVNSDAVLGCHCIINTNSSVDHDSILQDFVSIAPNAALGGSVQIGYGSAVGIGANIVHNIKVGEHCVLGGGALLTRDLPAQSVAYGVPAKVIRKREAGEPYL